jgi:hypothetical protein
MTDMRRLDAALDQIHDHPQLWNQSFWLAATDCGTAGCLAGWVVMLEYPNGEADFLDDDNCAVWVADGVPIDVYDEAVRLLDITTDQANRLFEPGNTWTDLVRYRGRLAADGRDDLRGPVRI